MQNAQQCWVLFTICAGDFFAYLALFLLSVSLDNCRGTQNLRFSATLRKALARIL